MHSAVYVWTSAGRLRVWHLVWTNKGWIWIDPALVAV